MKKQYFNNKDFEKAINKNALKKALSDEKSKKIILNILSKVRY